MITSNKILYHNNKLNLNKNNILQFICIMIMPFAYCISQYAFLIFFILESFFCIKTVTDKPNAIFLLFVNAMLYSCITLLGFRIYDWIIILGFIYYILKYRVHIKVPLNVFPLLILSVFMILLYPTGDVILESIRYVISFLLFIMTYNIEFHIEDVKNKLLILSIAAFYNAIIVYVLTNQGRIKEYSGLISSNIFNYINEGEIRLNGFFSDPNKYMLYCMMLFLIVSIYIKKSKIRLAIQIILFLASIISLSRTSIICFAVYFGLIITKFIYERNKPMAVAILVIFCFIISIFIFYPEILSKYINDLYILSTKMMGRQETLNINASFSDDNRLFVWKRAAIFIKESPIIGNGWLSYEKLLPYPTHNTVISLLLDGGIVTLVCHFYLFKKIYINKYWEYTIPFIIIPVMLLDLGNYRFLYLILGMMMKKQITIKEKR